MRLLLAPFCFLCFAVVASAEKVPYDGMYTDAAERGSCAVSAYKSFAAELPTPVSIPDNDAAGTIIGPIPTGPPGTPMVDVALEVTMRHTWVGDLVVELIYDAECDGLDGDDDTAVGILCRIGAADCMGSDFGCSGDFGDVLGGGGPGTYLFSTLGAISPDAACSSVIPPGCYTTDVNSMASSSLDDFSGMPKGGCFWLFASDNASVDTGEIHGITVYTFNDPGVPVETVSWGDLKARY